MFHHFSMFNFGFWNCWSSTSHQIRPRDPIVGGTTVPVEGRLSCKSSLNNEGLPKRNFGIWESKPTIQAPSEATATSRITIAFHTSSCSKAFSLALFPQVFFLEANKLEGCAKMWRFHRPFVESGLKPSKSQPSSHVLSCFNYCICL